MPHVPALVEALRAASTTSPDKPAVILPDRIFSFADLDRLSSTVAANLLDAGLRRAERIALHLTNGIEIVIAYYACFRIGAIALPINTRLKNDEIDYVLRHAEAAAYIGQELAREITDWPPAIRRRYVVGAALDGAQRFDQLLRPNAPRNFVAPAGDDPAVVLYTSGTTSRPRPRCAFASSTINSGTSKRDRLAKSFRSRRSPDA